MTGSPPGRRGDPIERPADDGGLLPGGLGYIPRHFDASPTRSGRRWRTALALTSGAVLVAAVVVSWPDGRVPSDQQPPALSGASPRPRPSDIRPTATPSSGVQGSVPAPPDDTATQPAVEAVPAPQEAAVVAADAVARRPRTPAVTVATASGETTSSRPRAPATTASAVRARSAATSPDPAPPPPAQPPLPAPTDSGTAPARREPLAPPVRPARPSPPPATAAPSSPSPEPPPRPVPPRSHPDEGHAADLSDEVAVVARAIAAIDHPGARNVAGKAWARASSGITPRNAGERLDAVKATLARHPQLTDDERASIASALAEVRIAAS